jgi:hypothetical protein
VMYQDIGDAQRVWAVALGVCGADVFDSGPGLAVFHQLRALVVEDQKVPVGFDEVLPGSVYSVGRLAFFWPTTMT